MSKLVLVLILAPAVVWVAREVGLEVWHRGEGIFGREADETVEKVGVAVVHSLKAPMLLICIYFA